MEKSIEDMKTSELLEEINQEEFDGGAFGELLEREPFKHLSEELEEAKKVIQESENKIQKLEKHHHIDGKVLYED